MAKNPKMIICRNCNTAISAHATRCPACGAKNKSHFYKKWWFFLIIIIVVIGVAASINRKTNNKIDEQTEDRWPDNGQAEYRWPDNELASMLPIPDSKYGKVNIESEDILQIDIYDISNEQFEDYIDECKKNGFIVDYSKFNNYYFANNEEGYSLDLSYNDKDKELGISIYAPSNDEKAEQSEDTVTSESVDGQKQEETNGERSEIEELELPEETNDSELVDGMRSEFKEAMDSYETFYNEYCEFLQQYSNNPTDVALIAEYAELVEQAEEVDKKFEAWEGNGMNDVEQKYYIEVHERILKKMREINL